MPQQDGVTLRSVVWSEVCPWLCILRTFRLAVSLRMLVFGAVAILLTLLGWGFLAWVFSADPLVANWWEKQYGKSGNPEVLLDPALSDQSRLSYWPWAAIQNAVPDQPQVPGLPSFSAAKPVPSMNEGEIVRSVAEGAGSMLANAPAPLAWRPVPATEPVFGVWAQLSRPIWELFAGPLCSAPAKDAEATETPQASKSLHMSAPALAFLVLATLWALAVWGFFGGAISRIAAVQLASDERVGWMAAIRFAGRKWISYFASPLFPLCGVLLAAVPLVLVGLLLRLNFGVLVLLVGLLWPLLLLGGMVMALLLLGLVFGWPLMWATVSTEGSDSFDALSRSYAYVFQRPLRYLFYAMVAALVGWVGWILVQNFAAGVVWLTYWAASWGASNDRMVAIASGQLEGIGYAGSALIAFWAAVVKWLALGYVYGYFWTAAVSVYFLLRRDVDATEMDEVYLDADETEPSHSLPPIKTDAAGAPVVVNEPAPPPAAKGDGDSPQSPPASPPSS